MVNKENIGLTIESINLFLQTQKYSVLKRVNSEQLASVSGKARYDTFK